MCIANWLIVLFLSFFSFACSSNETNTNINDGDIDNVELYEVEKQVDGDSDELEFFENNDEEITDSENSTENEQENENDIGGVNTALVFPTNPVATPDMIEVQLPAANDLDGVLTSTKDKNGLRKIAVYSCVDEGNTNTINVGQGDQTQRICTLAQRANKNTNGNFIYKDYEKAVAGNFDPEDIHAEVESFYHANKFYDFFTQPEVGVFDTIPNRHGSDKAPINFIVNFQTPAPEGSKSLQPIAQAMYLPTEILSVGMAKIYGLEGPKGDIIVLGQSSGIDFAYDGETIYHEMGHLMNQALANLSYTISLDQYGMSRMENALEQGLAETMTSLVSQKSKLFDYLGSGFVRDARNSLKYPDDYIGIDQSDAMIFAGAMWDVFNFLRGENVAETRLARLFLLTLQSLNADTDDLTFSSWATAFIKTMDSEGLQAHKIDVQTIFNLRGLVIQERARPIKDGEKGFQLYLGGAYQAMWNTVITLEMGTDSIPASTALIQLKSELFNQDKQCKLTAQMSEPPGGGGMNPTSKDWDLRLFVRNEQAVFYERQAASLTARIEYDEFFTATAQTDGSVSFDIAFPKEKYTYLHPVNLGDSSMLLSDIKLSCQ